MLSIVTEVLGTDAGHDVSVLLHTDGAAALSDHHRAVHTAQQDVAGETLAH